MDRAGRIERFEDLVAWQRARTLNREIYRLTMSQAFANDRELTRQIRRASLSVMTNIAEGFERGGRAEFAHFLSIAKASAGEVRSLLYAAMDVGVIDQSTFTTSVRQVEEVSRIVGGLRAAVARQREASS
jgi:four helix bundle protein